ncbi:hypothetical protein SNEBB_001536 [Seison nebaliae]|nr:hypothetical protein SNEBB_001536 [Seison nebaliae]
MCENLKANKYVKCAPRLRRDSSIGIPGMKDINAGNYCSGKAHRFQVMMGNRYFKLILACSLKGPVFPGRVCVVLTEKFSHKHCHRPLIIHRTHRRHKKKKKKKKKHNTVIKSTTTMTSAPKKIKVTVTDTTSQPKIITEAPTYGTTKFMTTPTSKLSLSTSQLGRSVQSNWTSKLETSVQSNPTSELEISVQSNQTIPLETSVQFKQTATLETSTKEFPQPKTSKFDETKITSTTQSTTITPTELYNSTKFIEIISTSSTSITEDDSSGNYLTLTEGFMAAYVVRGSTTETPAVARKTYITKVLIFVGSIVGVVLVVCIIHKRTKRNLRKSGHRLDERKNEAYDEEEDDPPTTDKGYYG